MKIITKELAEKLPLNHKFLQYEQVNPQKKNNIINILKNRTIITVYDRTSTSLFNVGEILGVKDHINRTGTNPLIKNQNFFNIDFIDIQKTYKTDKNYVITDCCGNELNLQYSYPSHYLCNIAIIVRAMKYKNIQA